MPSTCQPQTSLVSIGWARIEDLDAALPGELYVREALPYDAAFLGGTRRSPMPDFLIGAHAAVAGYTLLSRDRARCATYFPTVALICPD